jgi:hypothetical protein
MAILLSVTLLPTDGQASASGPLPPSVIESVEEGVDITPMDTKTLDALNAALLKNNKDIAPNGAIWCECVRYIVNRYGLKGSAHAKDMGSVLVKNGFRKVQDPKVGAVVIFQPAFGPGINQKSGHIGVIDKVQSVNNNKSWSITVRGANQGGSLFTDFNCNNVSRVAYKTYTKGIGSVSYYVK